MTRAAVEEDYSASGDEELLFAADQVFLELDRREEVDEDLPFRLVP